MICEPARPVHDLSESAELFKSFDQPETFSGIGVAISPTSKGLRVISVFNSSPADALVCRAEK